MAFSYKVGLGNAASFQVSGRPFASGSIVCEGPEAIAVADNPGCVVNFPSVTKWVVVQNNDTTHTNTLKVGFSAAGVDGSEPANRFLSVGPVTGSVRLDLKLSQVWLSGSSDVDVVAGLTSIPITEINNPGLSPDGSNWSGSTGV